MKGHNYEDAWDKKEFENLYKLFEEDEETTDKDDSESLDGLDRGEFRKLVVRMAQL